MYLNHLNVLMMDLVLYSFCSSSALMNVSYRCDVHAIVLALSQQCASGCTQLDL